MYTTPMAGLTSGTGNEMPLMNPLSLEKMVQVPVRHAGERVTVPVQYAGEENPAGETPAGAPSVQRLGLGARVALYAAVIAGTLFGYAGRAHGQTCPLGVPVPDALPQAPITWVNGFPKPAGFGNFTGADASTDSPYAWICTDAGILHQYDFSDLMNPLLVQSVNTGIGGMSGVTLTPTGFAVSSGTLLYEGSVTNGAWTTANSFHPIGIASDIRDVHWARGLGLYFISTANDGVRRVNADYSTTEIITPRLNSMTALKLSEFNGSSFCNPMVEIAQASNAFKNTTPEGMGYGSPHQVGIGNPGIIHGVGYFDGGFVAVVQSGGTSAGFLYSPLTGPQGEVQQHMLAVPEPIYFGDMDEDGDVDFDDVDDFVLALTDPASYQALYPNRNIMRGDMNQDGDVDGEDIRPFLDVLQP